MKEFHFSKTYFKTLTYDDREANIRVLVKEIPSLEISEEEYSLRVETHHEEESLIHRHYAIEHHSKFDKHNYPHLQFKFHTEEIGTFWLRLDFESPAEYKRAILGFIYKMKEVISNLERIKPGIAADILVLDLVNALTEEGTFLSQKIAESITKYQVEFQNDGFARDKANKLTQNQLLLDFLGKENVSKVVESYTTKKRNKL